MTSLSFLAFALSLQATAAPAMPVPFTFVDNRMTIQCRIDGSGPYTMIVDTGSSDVVVDAATAAKLGLHVRAAANATGAGNAAVASGSARLANLSIGALSFADLPATVLDLSEIRTKFGFPHLDGVVGYSVMRRFAVDVDVDRSTISFLTSAPDVPVSATHAAFTLDGATPVIRARIDGIDTTAIVDTGDRSSLTLFGPFARAHHFYTKYPAQHDVVTGYGIGGPIYGDVFTIPTLEVFGRSLSGVTARASRQTGGAFASPDHGGSIGEGVLKRFHLVVDYPHAQIIAWPSAGYGAVDRFNPPPVP